jgi:cholesterol transport system auxiliary component
MKAILRCTQALVLVPALLLLAGCAGAPSGTVATYDFGLDPAPSASIPALAARVANVEVISPGWLSTSDIVYRLAYQDVDRVHVYNHSRWIAAPAELIRERARVRVAAETSGDPGSVAGAAMSEAAGKEETPQFALRIELLEFSQVFRSPQASAGLVRVHASLVERRSGGMLAERTFSVEREAPSANAQGAVGALGRASDAMISQVFAWAEQQLPGGRAKAVAQARGVDPGGAAQAGASSASPSAGPLLEGPAAPKDVAVCVFVAQLEAGPLAWASTFEAQPAKVIDKLIALNSGPEVSDDIKKDLYPWIREAVQIAYASGDDATDKAKVLFVECAGKIPDDPAKGLEPDFV